MAAEILSASPVLHQEATAPHSPFRITEAPPRPPSWFETPEQEQFYYAALQTICTKDNNYFPPKTGELDVPDILTTPAIQKYQEEVAMRYKRMMPGISGCDQGTIVSFTQQEIASFAADE